MSDPPPPPKKTGLSLYANLLDPDKQKGATISSAPVRYDVKNGSGSDDAAKKKDGTVTASMISVQGS